MTSWRALKKDGGRDTNSFKGNIWNRGIWHIQQKILRDHVYAPK